MEKTIRQLAALLPEAKVVGNENICIGSIAHDSRKVSPGALFVCITGATVDGHRFIGQAAQRGAVAILTDRDIDIDIDIDTEALAGMTVLRVTDVRDALRRIVPFFYDNPARKMRMIGITGTNGKTTVSYLVRAILRAAGHKVGLIGTIQTMIEDEVRSASNTTPDIVDLQGILFEMEARGIEYVVMEVSSHALAMDRVAGCEFDTAVFTNMTQDHLDYHKTFDNYIAAKALLFEGLSDVNSVKRGKTAVINMDDGTGAVMAARCGAARVVRYGVEYAGDLRAENIEIGAGGACFHIAGAFGRMELALGITGMFNVYNVTAAVGAALAEGVEPDVIRSALGSFQSVPGRFELVDAGQDFSVIVDYAHTPDGLENILKTARQIAKRRILTVFGCGGDRDRTKRPIMGRIAATLSDVVLATSDNPRTENPEEILAEVEAGVLEKIGAKQHEKICDRRAAIERAIALAEPEDIVVIAGKGHETYQILNSGVIHFDDREVAREAIERRMTR